MIVQRSPKRRKITDFFQKELPNTEQQHETEPEQQAMPMFLRRYQPTSVPRRKEPVGRQSQLFSQAEQSDAFRVEARFRWSRSRRRASSVIGGVACPILLIIRPSGAEH